MGTDNLDGLTLLLVGGVLLCALLASIIKGSHK